MVGMSSRSAPVLLAQSRACLEDAARAGRPAERYAAAHLAALRAATAVLASRARPEVPGARPRRPASAWALLSGVAPELSEWAAFFAAAAAKRHAVEAGVTRIVGEREGDDLLRDAETFLAVCAATVGAGRSGAPTVLSAAG
ncbi:MAG: SAV_6107 family HEPN domain-containing protein [Mycobacteriales bacterium]